MTSLGQSAVRFPSIWLRNCEKWFESRRDRRALRRIPRHRQNSAQNLARREAKAKGRATIAGGAAFF
jgi:hypothetical protein